MEEIKPPIITDEQKCTNFQSFDKQIRIFSARKDYITECLKLKRASLARQPRPPRSWVAAVAELYRYQIVVCLVTSSSPVPLKTRRVGQRCTLNLSRAETSSHWCGVVVRRGDASSGVDHVT
ncbi:uncharacterized protein TNCV_4680261 [Trichonephila clavipes]|nr:uncharacterized protein TNCV_4680261 [Trichonephila clavipes]